MLHKYLNILLLILATTFAAAAQNVSVEMASKVEEGKKFTVTIKLENIQGNLPSAPDIPNCRLIYSGAMNSYSSNGHQSHSVTKITCTYLAQKAGKVTVPAVKIAAENGKTYTTKPRQLEIVAAGTHISAVDRTSSASDATPMTEGSVLNSDRYFNSGDMFVRISMNKNTVYEQEPVVVTVKLYTLLNKASQFQMLTQPTFEGFLSEELQVPNPQGTESLNGKMYNSYIVKRCVLYPQKAGSLKITSGTYDITLEEVVHFNSGTFLQDTRIVSKQVQTKEEDATLTVLPLPSPAPVSFNGAVGDFDATAELSSTHMRTNEPTRYTIKIMGTGNIKYLKTPELNLPEGLGQLTPKTDIDAQYSGGDISGTYTATYTLVPSKTGNLTIPPLDFTYFNPRTKQYKTIKLKGYSVDVTPGEDTDMDAEVKKMTDIRNIVPVTGSLDRNPVRVYFSLWYWLLYLLAAAGFCFGVFYHRRSIRLNADVQGRRLARAMRVAMKRFRTARDMMQRGDRDRFYEEISKALTGYLCDKLGIPASQLVRDNIAERLTAYGLDSAETDNIIAILDRCEMARFTPVGADSEMPALYDQVVSAVKSIENVKARANKPQTPTQQ